MVQLDLKYREMVKKILGSEAGKVRVFGSRAKGTARALSDLDLVLLEPTSREIISKLRDAFEDSDLPFKVDLIIWSEITEEFRSHIKDDLINL